LIFISFNSIELQNNNFSTLFIGQNLIKLSQVDSTNNFLKNLSSNSEPLPEGTVIMADFQSSGRGQRQNAWFSDVGCNLMFSLLLKPNFLAVEKQFELNMMISVAIHKALSGFLLDGLRIKWPNDIYFEDKKIGGILIENSIQGSLLKNSIIGIGINVNQHNFPLDLQARASSLTQILQRNVDLTELFGEICTQIEVNYLKLKRGDGKSLRTSYIEKLYRRGKIAQYQSLNGEFWGTIEGVNEIGKLLIRLGSGEVSEFNFKEILYL
jgi:BirA family biotin operon repressor/biotin-[acetyl-CoA-carboxylase] ligase